MIAATSRGWRVLERTHPPVYYFPPSDVEQDVLSSARRRPDPTHRMGATRFLDVIVGDRVVRAGCFTHDAPAPPFRELTGAFAFYPAKLDTCTVDGEVVRHQAGDHAGWITEDLVGPFKGDPGSAFW